MKTIDDYIREAEAEGFPRDASKPPPLEPIAWATPFEDDQPPPAQEWVIRDRIPNAQVVLFSGEGAAGKSTIALHEVAAHTLGRDWLGSMPEPGPAWFIDAEDGMDVIHRRLDIVRAHYDTTFAEMYGGGLRLLSLVGLDSLLCTANRNGQLTPTRFYAQLLAEAASGKPRMIVIASLANVYGGSELDRSQVQQFIALMRAVAVAANGAVMLISHPSVTGIATDTGISGSTQWHNAVRARFYLKGVKPDNGDPVDSDLRELQFRKNQYGPAGHSIVLRWKHGMFLPEGSGDPLEKLARESRADEVFLTVLTRYGSSRPVTDNPASPSNYAPRAFLKEPEALAAHLSKSDLEHAMARLFQNGRIRSDTWGPASKKRRFIVLA